MFKLVGFIFIYENRDTCQKKPIYVEITSDQIQSLVVNRILTVEAYKEKGAIPPKNKSFCAYCYRKTTCDKDGETDEI